MLIEIFALGPLLTNTIVVGCEKSRVAAVIDPSFEAEKTVLAYLKKKHLKLEVILLTHSHWDHIAGAKALKTKTGAPIYIHQLDKGNLEKPGSDDVPLLYKIEGIKADRFIQEGDEIKLGEIQLKVLHTPGHTPGSVCYFAEREKVLFSGDTLFQGTMGALHLPTSSAEKMWPSLKKLSLLPKDTVVIPGHGEKTTIGNEPWLSNAKKHFS